MRVLGERPLETREICFKAMVSSFNSSMMVSKISGGKHDSAVLSSGEYPLSISRCEYTLFIFAGAPSFEYVDHAL